MSTHNKTPFLRRRLGRRLRALREEAGLTLDQAAEKLDKSRAALCRIETGKTQTDVHFVRSCMDIYDHYDVNLVEEAREAKKPPWFPTYRDFDLGYVDLETHATLVKEFPGLTLPGLLQTEPYMRALFEAYRLRPPGRQANDIRVRLARQRRLTSEDNPLEHVAVIDEGAMRREVGGAEAMREQLRHLVEASALPTVSLHVLPLRNGAHSAMDGGFTLLSFPEPDDPDLLYVAYATSSLHIEDEDEVRRASLRFEELRTDALDPIDSVKLIEEIIREQYGP